MNRWVPILIAAATAMPALAAPNPKKIERLIESEKSDKAWAACAKEMEQVDAFADPALLEACAAARLAWLATANPDGLGVDNLQVFWEEWTGTAAAASAREMGSRQLLEEAGVDPERLHEIASSFPETEAGVEATRRLWEHAEATGTSAAALSFARDFPEAAQAGAAYVRASELAFGEAAKDDTPEAWRGFLDAWPNHPRGDEGFGRWEASLFTAAEQDDSSPTWRAFLEQWPNHPRRADAEKAWHVALFREADEGGPLALLSLAEEYPHHPKALKARELAQRRTAQVSLAATRGGTFWPLAFTVRPPDAPVPIEFDLIRVQPPREGEPPRARLVLVRDGEDLAMGRFSEVLAELGYPAELAPTSFEPLWGGGDGGQLEGRQEHRLCQPEGRETWFAVVVDTGGPEQCFPFRVADACADLPNPIEPSVALPLSGASVEFGTTRKAFLGAYPDFTAHRFGDTDTQCRAGDPSPQLCTLFYRGRLVGLFLAHAEDGGLTAAEREVGQTLREHLAAMETYEAPGDRRTVKRHRSEALLARDTYMVSADTGDPSGDLWIVHANLLAHARQADASFLGDLFPVE